MSENPKLRITVGPTGRTKIDAEGFVGEGCLIATKRLEEVLVSGDVVRTEKPEMHESPNEVGDTVAADRM